MVSEKGSVACSNFDGSNVTVHNIRTYMQYLQIEDSVAYYTHWKPNG